METKLPKGRETSQDHNGAGVSTEKLSRRKFLSYGIGGIATAIFAALAYPLAGYAVSPALRKQEEHWIAIGSIKDFKPGNPKKVDFSFRKHDGWTLVNQKSNVWVVAKGEGEFNIFSPKCTHLGCAYHWDDNQKKFMCPCHGGVFDITGKVLAGPPPRPLEKVSYRVQDGKLTVKGV